MTESKSIRWLPLESNPDVINKYVQALGLSGDKWQYVDVLGTDEELLSLVPTPVVAILLLFPITDITDEEDKQQLQRINKGGQVVSNNVWFMKQTIENACGTIGVLHTLGNIPIQKLGLPTTSPLRQFFEKTVNMDPNLKAAALEEAQTLAEVHEESAKEGQTQAPHIEDNVNTHFVAFVEKDGSLYELDGRKPFPINHGASKPDSFLQDAVKVIKEQFIARDPTQMAFSMIALSNTAS